MNHFGAGELMMVFAVLVIYPLLFVGFIALATLVARRVWRWDERRDQARRAAPLPPPQA